MRINNAAIPFETGLEPPGFLAMFPNRFGIRQAPVAKLRNDQRQIGAALICEVWEPDPIAAFGKFATQLSQSLA